MISWDKGILKLRGVLLIVGWLSKSESIIYGRLKFGKFIKLVNITIFFLRIMLNYGVVKKKFNGKINLLHGLC